MRRRSKPGLIGARRPAPLARRRKKCVSGPPRSKRKSRNECAPRQKSAVSTPHSSSAFATKADPLRAQRTESIGLLTGAVAHDLNNALAPVLMATEILQSDCSEPSQRRLLDAIRNGAALMKQILTFARGTRA